MAVFVGLADGALASCHVTCPSGLFIDHPGGMVAKGSEKGTSISSGTITSISRTLSLARASLTPFVNSISKRKWFTPDEMLCGENDTVVVSWGSISMLKSVVSTGTPSTTRRMRVDVTAFVPLFCNSITGVTDALHSAGEGEMIFLIPRLSATGS